MYLTENDEITMRLVHYFVTKENYQPIIVNGSENEIWLENIDKPYSVIRINANYIHNNDQLQYDLFRSKSIIKQIKRKTFSLTCDMLNIQINLGENVDIKSIDDKHVDSIFIETADDKQLLEIFPDLKNDKCESKDAVDFFLNVTKDINEATEKKNKLYEKTFGKKTIIATYVLIAINLVIYLLTLSGTLKMGSFSVNKDAILAGQYYRLITGAFFHVDVIHLACNMYSLYIIGTQIETLLGKTKYLIIYFLSALTASLLSAVLSVGSSVGASGAIFGLLGALLYFGYHYRLYLGNSIISNIIPIIIINLFIGFSIPNVDNFAHIGGLLGGVFSSMMVGIEGKTDKSDRINGAIISIIFIVFLTFMLFK
ncbi:MAG: rhomboid family intramembrane serine protease [Bacilli bacterium]|nr:rhomboid family intramembrane serine protease [Bacilli bacterium]